MVLAESRVTADHLDAFAELVNIAFGRAAGPLSELINEFVTLQVPKVEWVSTSEVVPKLEALVGGDRVIHIVRQAFKSSFRGEALLILDGGVKTGGGIASLFGMEDDVDPEEVALEMGNIVLGACIGKLAELLESYTVYSPPHIVVLGGTISDLPVATETQDLSHAILIRTGFQIEAKAFDGFLFLLLPPSVAVAGRRPRADDRGLIPRWWTASHRRR